MRPPPDPPDRFAEDDQHLRSCPDGVEFGDPASIDDETSFGIIECHSIIAPAAPLHSHLSFTPTNEHYLISAISLDVSVLDRVATIVQPSDFENPAAAILYEVLLNRSSDLAAGGFVELQLLAADLSKRGVLDAVGGVLGLAEIRDLEAGPAFAVKYAAQVREASLNREFQRDIGAVGRDHRDERAWERLVSTREALGQLRLSADSSVAIGLSGAALEAVLAESDSSSPLPGFLDPDPNLHIIHGTAKTGKTTFAWLIGLAWATGNSPWTGATRLPGSRVLILSAEQSTRKCVRVLDRIARSSGVCGLVDWKSRVTVVARRKAMPRPEQQLLRFDETGLRELRRELDAARKSGDPYGLVEADSLSRLKPSGSKLNDNDDMLAVLSELAEIAAEFGVYILLVHHDGHDPERQGKAIDGVRGASAIRDVPQVLIALSGVKGESRQRRVCVAGNEVPNLNRFFEVASADEPEGQINRFEPVGETELDVEVLFEDGPLGFMEFGRRALKWAPDRAPSGGAKEKAKQTLQTLVDKRILLQEGDKWNLASETAGPRSGPSDGPKPPSSGPRAPSSRRGPGPNGTRPSSKRVKKSKPTLSNGEPE